MSDSSAEKSADSILKSPLAQLAWAGGLIFLIIILIWVSSKKSPERMDSGNGVIGGGFALKPFTSGATMRLAQELSSTNMQPYSTPRNDDVRATASALAALQQQSAKSPEDEMLVNQGGYPDFWTITGELDNDRQDEVAAYRAGQKSENMVSDIFDTRMAGNFYPGASTF
jgi:hypothetical protein